MNLESYNQIPKDLQAASGFISKTEPEKVVELSPGAKLIYVYMLDRTKFFVEAQKGEHFETQQTIANACGLEVKSATRALGLFVYHGAIEASVTHKKGMSRHQQWYYRKVNTDIELTQRVDKGRHVSVETGIIYDVIADKTAPSRRSMAKATKEELPEYTDYDVIGIQFEETETEYNYQY